VKVVGIIPARYASTRFPGKALALVAGKPLIQRVIEQCQKAKSLSEVIVATDNQRIADVAKKICRVEMTRADHPSGTDRIAEVAGRIACDAIVNIQGDEPMIDPSVIDAVAGALAQRAADILSADTNKPSAGWKPAAPCEMSTAATRIKNPAELDNPNVVKVVVSAAGRALYFSRRTIPYLREGSAAASAASFGASPNEFVGEAPTKTREARVLPDSLAAFPFLKHLGIYGYRRETLLRLVKFPVSPLENAEKLEQLRALENGIPIAVVQVEYDSVGVDTPEDVAKVERILSHR